MSAKNDYKCKCVMVVDDNDIDRYIVKKVLSQNQFCEEVLSYGNPLEALEFLRKNQDDARALPDIIFLDIYMPELSGFEFMEAYAHFSDILKNHCGVYIVSSTIDPHDLLRAKADTNVISLHVKPIDSKFLTHVGEKIK